MPGNVMQSNNPTLDLNTLSGQNWAGSRAGVFTIQGAAIKALILLVLLSAVAVTVYVNVMDHAGIVLPLMIVGSLVGLGLAMVTCFKPEWAIVTAPLYTICQGLVLGTLSRIVDQAYPNLAIQAVMLTAGVFFIMLALYALRILRATPWLTRAIVAATLGICLVYFVNLLLSLFGIRIPGIFDAGPVGIIFSLFVVGVAAFNLIIDFDTIEQGAASGAPAGLEWYAAFALMVTVIWLYIEIVNLLIKLQNSSRQ